MDKECESPEAKSNLVLPQDLIRVDNQHKKLTSNSNRLIADSHLCHAIPRKSPFSLIQTTPVFDDSILFYCDPSGVFSFLVVTVGGKMILGKFHQIISVSDWYWFFPTGTNLQRKVTRRGRGGGNKEGQAVVNLYTLGQSLQCKFYTFGQRRAEKCKEWDSSHSRLLRKTNILNSTMCSWMCRIKFTKRSVRVRNLLNVAAFPLWVQPAFLICAMWPSRNSGYVTKDIVLIYLVLWGDKGLSRDVAAMIISQSWVGVHCIKYTRKSAHNIRAPRLALYREAIALIASMLAVIPPFWIFLQGFPIFPLLWHSWMLEIYETFILFED